MKDTSSIKVAAPKFPQLQQVHSALHNKPILPASIDDIVIENARSQTENNARFLMAHLKEIGEHLIISCSETCLMALAGAERWHADGTFKSAPGFNKFTSYAPMFKGHMIPCIYALLTCKTARFYKKLINELKEAALTIQLVLNSKILMTDFE
jgi:hypothetical protein